MVAKHRFGAKAAHTLRAAAFSTTAFVLALICLLGFSASDPAGSAPPSKAPKSAQVSLPDAPQASPIDPAQAAADFDAAKRAPRGGKVTIQKYIDARKHMGDMRSARQNSAPRGASIFPGGITSWTSVGPINISGRVRTLVIDPRYNPSTHPAILYAGGADGGIWKSVDEATWTPLDDFMDNLAVCALAIDPNNPDVLYAGTGEGFINQDAVRGLGIFKTINSGANWTLLAGTVAPAVPEGSFYQVNDIEVSAFNSAHVFAATSFGVFRSLDSGATWSVVLRNSRFIPSGAAPATDNATRDGCVDIAIKYISNPEVILAAFGNHEPDGLYRSTDGGATWAHVVSTLPAVGAAPGRASLAFSRNTPNIAYLSLAQGDSYRSDFGVISNVYKSSDSGATWSPQINFAHYCGYAAYLDSQAVCFCQRNCSYSEPNPPFTVHFAADRFDHCPATSQPAIGWYANTIAIDPGNDSTIWMGGADLFRSTGNNIGSGIEWSPLAFGWLLPGDLGYPDHYIHSYQHCIVFQPGFTGSAGGSNVYVCNDGGVFRTVSGGRQTPASTTCPANASDMGSMGWQSISTGLNVTQFYHGDAAIQGSGASRTEIYVGGTQGNGTLRTTSAPASTPFTWSTILLGEKGNPTTQPNLGALLGDGGFTLMDPFVPSTIYASTPSNIPYPGVPAGASLPIVSSFGKIRKSLNSGSTFADANTGLVNPGTLQPLDVGLYITPLAMDPDSPDILWTGGQRPWRTTNTTPVWEAAGPQLDLSGMDRVSAICVAHQGGLPNKIIYMGLENGAVAVSTNAQLPSPTWTLHSGAAAGLSDGAFVSCIAVDNTDPTIAYLTYSTFGVNHILKSVDTGAHWSPIVGSGQTAYPDLPAHWVTQSPHDPSVLYVASDLGVFVTEDGGTTWSPVGQGMPNTVVENLRFPGCASCTDQVDADTLIAFTHGRGAFRAPICSRARVNGQLDDQTGCVGGSVTFTIDATGTAPISYAWQVNGQPAGANASFLTVNNLTLADEGKTVACTVSNACGSEPSNSAVIHVQTAIAITAQPTQTLQCNGANVHMSVTATGSALAYQWTKNNSDINGATLSTFDLTPFQVADAGTYRVRVSNTGCNPVLSDPVVLADCNSNSVLDVCETIGGSVPDCNLDLIPDSCQAMLSAHLGLDATICAGSGAYHLTAPTVTNAVGAPTYAWQITSGPAFTGIDNPAAAAPNFTPPLPGTYNIRCTVTDAGPGDCQSADSILVTVVPQVVAHVGTGQYVACIGRGGIVLGDNPVATGGQSPYTYQWTFVSGPATSGLSSATVANPTFTPTTAGNYVLRLVAKESSSAHCEARVNVNVSAVPAIFASAGNDINMCIGQPAVTLTGNPTGSGGNGAFTYAWTVANGPTSAGLANAGSSAASFDPVLAGEYDIDVAVNDSGGGACNSTDRVHVSVAETMTVDMGTTVQACVGVPSAALGGFPLARGGHPPYTYLWSQIAGPHNLTFDDTSSSNPRILLADIADTYRVRVVVRDSGPTPCQAVGELDLRVIGLTAMAGLNRTVNVGDDVPVGGAPTANGGNPPYAYFWSFLQNPGNLGTLDNDRTPNPTFTGFGPGNYKLRVTVTESGGCQGADDVEINVVQTGGGTDSSSNGDGSSGSNPLCAIFGGGGTLMLAMLPFGIRVMKRDRRGHRQPRA